MVVTERRGSFACASLTNSKGTTTDNYLPVAALRVLPATEPALDKWVGHWKTGEQAITISIAASGQLAVEGTATFGAHDPGRVKRGAVNRRSLWHCCFPRQPTCLQPGGDGKTLPFNEADDNACRIRMERVGLYLWAWEQGCGGISVSFDGVYARARH